MLEACLRHDVRGGSLVELLLPLEGGGRRAMSYDACRKCCSKFNSHRNSSLARRVGVAGDRVTKHHPHLMRPAA